MRSSLKFAAAVVVTLSACGSTSSGESAPVAAPPDQLPAVEMTVPDIVEPNVVAASDAEIAAAMTEPDGRVTVSLDRATDGTVGFWTTSWVSRSDSGSEVVCIGDPYSVACHDDSVDSSFMNGKPLWVLASGFTPVNGVVLLVEPGVTEIEAVFADSVPVLLRQHQFGTRSGRSVVSFENPTDAAAVVVRGLVDGSDFETELALATPPPIYPVEVDGEPIEIVPGPVPDPAGLAHAPVEVAGK